VTLIILVLVVLVVAAALAYNRPVWRPRQSAVSVPEDGLKVWELTARLRAVRCAHDAPAERETAPGVCGTR
jgi:hypothetical protein